jgi:hypothetical protein
MLDRVARDRTAELLRHLASGRISNDEFEGALPQETTDSAVLAVQRAAWMLYSDLSEHKLTGEHALSAEAKEVVARSIVFLYSDLSYEWPQYRCEGLVRLFAGLVSLGWIPRYFDAQWKRAGDFNVWPFIRHEDYAAALQRPKLLASALA